MNQQDIEMFILQWVLSQIISEKIIDFLLPKVKNGDSGKIKQIME